MPSPSASYASSPATPSVTSLVTSPATTPAAALAVSRRDSLDRPALVSSDAPEEAQWRMLGMHCAGCVGTIERLLQTVPGVQMATVNPVSEVLWVRWQASLTRPATFLRLLLPQGYEAVALGAVSEDAALAERHRREWRDALWRVFVAGFCMMQIMMLATPVYVAAPGEISPDIRRLLDLSSWILTLPVMGFSAQPFLTGAWRAMRQRHVSMDLPVALGLVVTFVVSTWACFDPGGLFGYEVYFDSLAMFVFVLLGGRLLAQRARHRAVATLEAASDRIPLEADRLLGDATLSARAERVRVSALQLGDAVRVAAGDAFPTDGVVHHGRTEVDEAIVTGESLPVPKAAGDEVLAGSINLSAPIVMRVLRAGSDTRYHGIVALLRGALAQRPQSLALADRVAQWFLWGVLVLAALAGLAWWFIDPARAPWVVVSVLIVTCPCALGLAAPVSLLAAASRLAQDGVLVHRMAAIEQLAVVDTVMLDKTGTVTDEHLAVQSVQGWDATARDSAEIQARLGALAQQSRHPAAQAVARWALGKGVARATDSASATAQGWHSVQEQAGLGLTALDDRGMSWRLGSWAHVMDRAQDTTPDSRVSVWFGQAGKTHLGFELGESLRTDAPSAIDALRSQGLAVQMLSGDAPARAEAVAQQLGMDAAHGGLSPQEKLDAVASAQDSGHRVLMVGDGINDAPVLARADVSFAMGHAARVAQRQADFVLLRDRLSDVVQAVAVAKRYRQTVRVSFGWAAAYNFSCVPLALTGWLPPWAAAIGMAASSLFIVVYAQRLMRAPLAA